MPLSNYRNPPGPTIKGFEIELTTTASGCLAACPSWMTGKHDGAYSNPLGTERVGARHPPPKKWVAMLGLKVRNGTPARLAGTSSCAGPTAAQRSLQRRDGYRFRRYHTRSRGQRRLRHPYGFSPKWVPAKLGLKDTRIDFTVDNLFTAPIASRWAATWFTARDRNAKISVTQFFEGRQRTEPMRRVSSAYQTTNTRPTRSARGT